MWGRAQYAHGSAEEDPLSLLLPQSGGKSQFPLLARGAEGCAQLARWSSTPSATQQPCCISPSVFLRPLGTKIQLGPLAVNRSCFGCSLLHLRTAAACLSRCFRHWRRSKAKPLRGSRGRSRAVHRIAAVHNSSFRIPHSHSPFNFLPVGQKNSSTCTG